VTWTDPAHITTAEELTGNIPSAKLAAWREQNAAKVAAMPPAPELDDLAGGRLAAASLS
jgi:hypothetical protein